MGHSFLRGNIEHLLDVFPIGIACIASDHSYVFANRIYAEWFGVAAPEIVGRSMREVLPAPFYDEAVQHIPAVLSGKPASFTAWVKTQGRERLLRVRYAAYPGGDGAIARWFALLDDVSDCAHEQERLRRLAATDTLTGIANRRGFLEHAERALAAARHEARTAALLIVDIDRFKEINDRFGHALGDRVIRAVSRACLGAVRSGDGVGRLGGDEFAVLLVNTSMAAAAGIAERLRAAVEALDIEATAGAPVRLSVSIGVSAAVAPRLDRLFDKADAALYRAKRQGRNRIAGVDAAPGEADTAPCPGAA